MAEEAGIFAREFPYLDCYVQLGVAQGRVISVSFPAQPDDDSHEDHDLLDRIERYLQGERIEFTNVTVALTVPTDQRHVLEAVRGVSYGEEATVSQVATMTAGLSGEDDATLEEVRLALDGNPAPIFVPDHRVRDGPSAAPPPVEQKLRSIEEL
jgi:methylated-DNA-[protein]-cysteine S-methyltransferase